MFDAVLENDLNSESPIGKSVSDSFREIAQKNNIGLVYTMNEWNRVFPLLFTGWIDHFTKNLRTLQSLFSCTER